MREEIYKFEPSSIRNLIGREISLEDNSDNGCSYHGERISDIGVVDDILSITIMDVTITKYDGKTTRKSCVYLRGATADIIDPKVSENGRITFSEWDGYDLIVIYPPNEKR